MPEFSGIGPPVTSLFNHGLNQNGSTMAIQDMIKILVAPLMIDKTHLNFAYLLS